MASERLYTLEQAKTIGLREVCARKGHDIQHMRAENWDGQVCIDYYKCGVCDVVISFTYPGQTPIGHTETCSAQMLMHGHAYCCTRPRDHGDGR